MEITKVSQKPRRSLTNLTIIDITTSPMNTPQSLNKVSSRPIPRVSERVRERVRERPKNNSKQTKKQPINSKPTAITKPKFPSYLYDPKCHSVKIARKRWGNMIH